MSTSNQLPPRVADGGPNPSMVYINHSEYDDIYLTDEYGRDYDNATALDHDLTQETLLPIRRIVEGKDTEAHAMLYIHDDSYVMRSLSRLILYIGRKRIIFRKKGQKVYHKKWKGN